MTGDDRRPGRTAHEIAGTFGRALVPLTLVALFFVRMDLATSILWLGGFAVFAWSFVRLVRELFGRRVLTGVLVALAGVALFPLACVNLARATTAAHSATRALAGRAQSACQKDGRCPSVSAHADGNLQVSTTPSASRRAAPASASACVIASLRTGSLSPYGRRRASTSNSATEEASAPGWSHHLCPTAAMPRRTPVRGATRYE